MRPCVTVIVPVYNVANYIEKCARSLFEQTLESLELIFIDDCSPDNSIEIIERALEDYPHRRHQTKIIKNSSNTGLAGVRKIGILESNGEYIIHCDGDDWVDKDLYEKMYQEAIKDLSDIVFCGIIDETPQGAKKRNVNLNSDNGRDLIKNWYKSPFSLYCWNKLVKHNIYTNYEILPWINLNMWEDNGLMSRILYYSGKVSSIDNSFCHYNRLNTSSITYQYGEKETKQMIRVAENLTSFFQEKEDYKEFENTARAFQYYAKLNLITDSFKNYKLYKKIFKDSNKIINFLPLSAFSKRGKIRFQMVKYGFAPLFILLFKMKNTFLPSVNIKR